MTPSALLGLMRLASPALPVGGFSYSEALEAAVDTGQVQDESNAADWLSDQLHLQLARADLPLLAAAHAAWGKRDLARIGVLNDWALVTRETAELRLQTEQMGRSMVDWLRTPEDETDARFDALARLAPAPAWPIAFALAAVRAGAGAVDALLTYGFAWAENQVQAALKAVPLGQRAGQRILSRLAQELPPLAETALSIGDDDRRSFTPLLAIRSSQHETQYSRLFRS
jgi:urease accessory protein